MFSILIKKKQRCGAFGLLWEDTVDNVYNEFLHDTKPKYRYYWKLLMEVYPTIMVSLASYFITEWISGRTNFILVWSVLSAHLEFNVRCVKIYTILQPSVRDVTITRNMEFY